MSKSKRIKLVVLLIVAVIGLIMYAEWSNAAYSFTVKEKEAIEKRHFKTVEAATAALMDAAAIHGSANGNGYEPLKHGHTLYRPEIVSNGYDDNQTKVYYTIAYIIKDSSGYVVKVRDRDIYLEESNEIRRDNFKIGNSSAQYYVGPTKNNPFEEKSLSVFSKDASKVIAFNNQIIK